MFCGTGREGGQWTHRRGSDLICLGDRVGLHQALRHRRHMAGHEGRAEAQSQAVNGCFGWRLDAECPYEYVCSAQGGTDRSIGDSGGCMGCRR